MIWRFRHAALVLLALFCGPAQAGPTEGRTAEPGKLTIELNKLESLKDACRAYFVINNNAGQPFSDIKLDIFIFGQDGVIARRFAIGTGPLRPGKTVVRLFDIPDLACGSAQSFLLNEVLSCAGPAGPIDSCGDLIVATARGDLAFGE